MLKARDDQPSTKHRSKADINFFDEKFYRWWLILHIVKKNTSCTDWPTRNYILIESLHPTSLTNTFYEVVIWRIYPPQQWMIDRLESDWLPWCLMVDLTKFNRCAAKKIPPWRRNISNWSYLRNWHSDSWLFLQTIIDFYVFD